MSIQFRDRQAAGQQLARGLSIYANQPKTLVLGLPRGGVPVAYEVAQFLRLPLDICLVRKLGLPAYPELAMGAIGTGGVQVLNNEVIGARQISPSLIEQVVSQERQELKRREQAYRGDSPAPDIAGRRIILVDDGIATGATMYAAIAVIHSQHPKEIIVAVPLAPITTYRDLQKQVDRVVCLATPSPFHAVGCWYEHFPQVTDEQVNRLLRDAIAAPVNERLTRQRNGRYNNTVTL